MEELRDEGRFAGCAAAEVSRRPFAEELGEPGLVLDLFVENGEREVVSAVILARGQVADMGVAAHSSPRC